MLAVEEILYIQHCQPKVYSAIALKQLGQYEWLHYKHEAESTETLTLRSFSWIISEFVVYKIAYVDLSMLKLGSYSAFTDSVKS